MHITLVGVHFKQRAIALPKLSKWGPACSQPVCHIQDKPNKDTSATTLVTLGFLLVEPLVERLNRW